MRVRPGAMTAMINYYRANAAAFLKTEQSRPVQTPTLMVWGEQDIALGVELTKGYDGLVDDFTLSQLPGASHWVQQDAPGIVNETLAAWLGGTWISVRASIRRCRSAIDVAGCRRAPLNL